MGVMLFLRDRVYSHADLQKQLEVLSTPQASLRVLRVQLKIVRGQWDSYRT